jgi:hypothetical protein
VCAETGTAFIMYDGDISENTGSDYGGVYTEGTFTLKGGTISGNDGHGIFTTGLFTMHNGTVSGNGNFGIGIGTTGTFTMHNGTVSGNGTGTVFGGGVYILGTFTMDGGTICDNKNSYRSTEARYTMRNGGAGVRVYGNGTFTMNDGTISGNCALYTTGGGVSVSATSSSYNPKFIMNGGTISGNSGILGGGVYVYNGTFEMAGGTVTDNTAAEGRGGGVYVYSTGTFTKTGGTIHGDTPASNAHTPGDKTTNTALYFNDKDYKAEQNGHAVFVDRGTTTHIYYWRNATLGPYTSISSSVTTARLGVFEGYRIAP